MIQSTGTVGLATTKRYIHLHGVIDNEPVIGPNERPFNGFRTAIQYTVELDMDCLALAATYLGSNIQSSPNAIITGRFIWRKPNQACWRVFVLAGVNPVIQLINLITTITDAGSPVIRNAGGAVADVVIKNCAATNAVSPLGLGVNQLVENILIDSNI